MRTAKVAVKSVAVQRVPRHGKKMEKDHGSPSQAWVPACPTTGSSSDTTVQGESDRSQGRGSNRRRMLLVTVLDHAEVLP